MPNPKFVIPTYKDRDVILLALGFPSYTVYLVSTLWVRIRSRRLKYDEYTCILCGSPSFCVHHIDYTEENLSGESLEGLVSLCRSCHVKVEFAKNGSKRSLPRAKKIFLKFLQNVGTKSSRIKWIGKCYICGKEPHRGRRYCRSCSRSIHNKGG